MTKTVRSARAAGRCMWAALSAALSAALLAGTATQAVAAGSQLEFLGALSGGSSLVTGVNDLGQVVGASSLSDGGWHAALWSAGASPLDLGSAGALSSRATAINNAGQIAGFVYEPSALKSSHAVAWTGDTMSLLATPAGKFYSQALSINQSGQIGGSSAIVENSQAEYATLWTGGQPSLVGQDQHSVVQDVNDSGQMAGYTFPDGGLQPTRWAEGYPMTVGVLPSFSSLLPHMAMNGSGQMVGTSAVCAVAGCASTVEVPTLWPNATPGYETPIALALPAGTQGAAQDINDAGWVVGRIVGATSRATLWEGAKTIDLNSFLDVAQRQQGWVLADATAVSNSGWIAGEAYNAMTGATAGFRLSVAAVPEAESGAMMLVSLLALGGLVRGRKRWLNS